MQFLQNKARYPILSTLNSLDKKYITSIFKILFPEGPVLFDSPRISNDKRFNGWQLAKMKKSIPDMSLP